jgi:hypothetical protein
MIIILEALSIWLALALIVAAVGASALKRRFRKHDPVVTTGSDVRKRRAF